MSHCVYVRGDIFEAAAQHEYLCHQCNCLTTKSVGMAASVFLHYPWADVYSTRTAHSVPGTILVRGNPSGNPSVVAMFAQYYPGRQNWSNDNPGLRLKWFRECLEAIAKLPNLGGGVAFPWKIGCVCGGGDWTKYQQMLEDFARDSAPPNSVFIYQLPSGPPKDQPDKKRKKLFK